MKSEGKGLDLRTVIKPCPFCGSKLIDIFDNSPEDEPESDWLIQCLGCGCAVIASNDAMPVSRDELVRKWNSRTHHVTVNQYGKNPTSITNLGEQT